MIGINGFGRVGRLALRSIVQNKTKLRVAAINDPNMDIEYMKYLLLHDSAYYKPKFTVELYNKGLIVNGEKIRVYHTKLPNQVPWGDSQSNIVIESSGVFLEKQKLQLHFIGGAKKVIVSASAKDDTPTFVMGVNHKDYKPHMDIVSNASCTTNCLATIAQVINNQFILAQGLLTTYHSITSTQNTIDGIANSKKDWRAGRAAHYNFIPSTTNAAGTIGLVMPHLKGKVSGMSIRVPIFTVTCVIDFTFKTQKAVKYLDICQAMKTSSEGDLKGILGYTNQQVVSTDFIGNPSSSIFDQKAGLSLNPYFHKVVAWYDNEWGYTNRVIDLAHYISKVCKL